MWVNTCTGILFCQKNTTKDRTLESAYVILLFIWICAALHIHITLSNIGESSEMYYYYLRIMAQV